MDRKIVMPFGWNVCLPAALHPARDAAGTGCGADECAVRHDYENY
jgi:hypothetical protein